MNDWLICEECSMMRTDMKAGEIRFRFHLNSHRGNVTTQLFLVYTLEGSQEVAQV